MHLYSDRLNTACSTSRTPMAPAKVLSSLNSATGAVSARCMASITVLSEVPGVAQNTGWSFLPKVFSASAQETHDATAPFRLDRRHLVVLVELEARRLAPVEPDPAALVRFQFAFAAHHVPGGEHAQADSHSR